eukprot:52177_1
MSLVILSILITLTASTCPDPLYICPVVKGCKVNQKYRPTGSTGHYGLDLWCSNKVDKIRAVAGGEIVEATIYSTNFYNSKIDYDSLPPEKKRVACGTVVMIQHSDKRKTRYCHLDKMVKGLKIGSLVKTGDIIGTCGNTGWSGGPHLHFEYYNYKETGGYIDDPWKCIARTGLGTGSYGKAIPYKKPEYKVPQKLESIKEIKDVKTKFPKVQMQKIKPLPKVYKGEPVGLRGDSCGRGKPKCHPLYCRCKGLFKSKCKDKKDNKCPVEIFPSLDAMEFDGGDWLDLEYDDDDVSVVIMEFSVLMMLFGLFGFFGGCVCFGIVIYALMYLKKK